MINAISSHYAEAFADAVFAENSGLSPDQAKSELRGAAETLASSKNLELAFRSPAISKPKKQELMGKLAGEFGYHRLVRNLLMVLISHRRIADLSAIAESFDLIVDERTGWIPASITSAHELSAEQKQSVEEALGTQLGKFIRAQYSVDPSLIGGIRAHVAAKEYDSSIRGKLEHLRWHLSSRH